ncbi:glycosyltransferase [Clostridium mediterraneense]|uniref:glycosyltransferase n=1 Tax=Clostridium mediterraneense TaxID=1805472 RepID=UPI0008375911|nr:glycosyltransferase [Clostridium mediterraneense]
MKFSVLMSVYYKEDPKYLKEAIESILNQTVMPSEIVIIKDGKLGDNLNNILDQFDKNYKSLFKFIEFEENQGLGIALRRGVEECSYEIIARMDTDDIAAKNRFERELAIMQEKNLDMVGSNIVEFDGNIENIISKRNVPDTDENIKSYAKKRNPFNHMTVMYKKSAVLKAGNYKNFLWFEDYNLWIRMIMNGAKMYNIQENLVYARTGASMFERRGGVKYIKREYKMQKEMLKIKFISYKEFIFNILTRSAVRIMPNKLRGFVYMKMLR